jgi:hypothetical protein
MRSIKRNGVLDDLRPEFPLGSPLPHGTQNHLTVIKFRDGVNIFYQMGDLGLEIGGWCATCLPHQP